jgi:AcrR family transcriptional regulator
MVNNDSIVVAGPISDLRSEMSRSDDPKVLRTRAAIFSAAEEIAASGQPLAVKAIVKTAHISRSVFYAHFSGVEEIAIALIGEALSSIGELDVQQRLDPDIAVDVTARTSIGLVVDHVLRFRHLYHHVLPANPLAHHAALNVIAVHMRKTIDVMTDLPAGVDPADAARFLAGGCLELLLDWLEREPRPARDEMVARLGALFPQWE